MEPYKRKAIISSFIDCEGSSMCYKFDMQKLIPKVQLLPIFFLITTRYKRKVIDCVRETRKTSLKGEQGVQLLLQCFSWLKFHVTYPVLGVESKWLFPKNMGDLKHITCSYL